MLPLLVLLDSCYVLKNIYHNLKMLNCFALFFKMRKSCYICTYCEWDKHFSCSDHTTQSATYKNISWKQIVISIAPRALPCSVTGKTKQIQQLYLTVIRADSSMFTVCCNCVVLKFYKYYNKMLQPVISLTYTCVLGRFWQLCGCFCMQSSTQRNNERIFHSVKLFSW